MTRIHQHLDQLRRIIPELTPQEVNTVITKNEMICIDVRESDETSNGIIPGAHRIPRGFLELRIEDLTSDRQQSLILYCGSGMRSLLAARDLKALGYENVFSLKGGFQAWQSSGLPFDQAPRLNQLQRERYLRHIRIPEVGEDGQLKLLASKVLLVGAGGLGSPIALYLAAAGVGTIGIIDPDKVDRSNLQRQILHKESKIGQAKVLSAKEALEQLNPDVRVLTYCEMLNHENGESIIKDYDVIVDGTDNFKTRYLVNDLCIKLGKPNVHGSIFRFEGQVSVFWPAFPGKKGPCYRCLFPKPPPAAAAPSCAEAGVLGVLPGVIGMLEAVETLKILLNIGKPLIGRIMTYDALESRFQELRLEPDPDCPVCQRPVEEIQIVIEEDHCRI